MLVPPEIQTHLCTTTYTGSPSISRLNQRSLHTSHRSTAPAYNAPTTYATRTVYPRNYGTTRLPSSATATNPARLTHRSLSQTLTAGILYPKSNPLYTCLPYLGSTSHKLQSILQQAGIKVYHSAPNFNDFSTPIRINRISEIEREYTRSLVMWQSLQRGNRMESSYETERTPSTRL